MTEENKPYRVAGTAPRPKPAAAGGKPKLNRPVNPPPPSDKMPHDKGGRGKSEKSDKPHWKMTQRAPTRKLARPDAGRETMLYGFHAVKAAWLNPKRECRALYLTENAALGFQKILDEAKALGLSRPEPDTNLRNALDMVLPNGAVHQGIALDCAPLPELELEDALAELGADEPACYMLLDQVTDPHNVGAIMRSAAAFGVKGLICQDRYTPSVTGVVAKTASGAVEYLPIIRVVNLARALERLKELGFVGYALDEKAEMTLAEAVTTHQTQSPRRSVLAMGAEGAGLRPVIISSCTVHAKLPTGGPIGSLNVSNAAAVALYEMVR